MYYAHFGLKEPPFKITPNTEFFFTGGNRGAILDALMYAITSGEGIVKVVGEVGSGKTMICRMLQTQLPENIESVYLANPSVAPEDVLHAIAFELQLQLPQNADRLQVMQVLQKYLLDRHAEGKQVVIFVEEAQGMPLATLEEIRLLSNLETKHDKLLQIVLFGQPELDVNLNANQIRQLRERITHSFNLGPLDEKAIGDYLIFRLRAAGYFGPHLFTSAAIARIAKSAEGLVRRVNILADKALLAAFSQNVYQVTPKHVRAAIKDSEFGAEQVRRALKLRTLLAIAATLLVGLAIGYLINPWLPTLSSSKSASINSVSQPATKLTIAGSSQKQLREIKPEPVKPEQVKHEEVKQPAQEALPQAQVIPTEVNERVELPKPAQSPVAVVNPFAPIKPEAAKGLSSTPLTPALAQPAVADIKADRTELASATDILQLRLDEAQLWLKQQPASTVTIQLMGAANDDQLRRQLNSLVTQLEPSCIYPLRTQVNVKPVVSVLYG
ncbi:MAG: AAA family ATPase, partial [Candidatus Methylopumilus sp.]